MTDVLVYGYLGGWVIATVVAGLMAWRLRDKRDPPAHPVLLSLVAGAAWPVLVIAVAEATAFAVTTEVMHENEPQLSVVA